MNTLYLHDAVIRHSELTVACTSFVFHNHIHLSTRTNIYTQICDFSYS